MNIQKLKQLLGTIGIPVTYRLWGKGQAPSLPYLVYYEEDTKTVRADNQVLFSFKYITIECYSKRKDLSLEQQIEELFTTNQIVWEASDNYLLKEEMQVRYYEIIIRGECNV